MCISIQIRQLSFCKGKYFFDIMLWSSLFFDPNGATHLNNNNISKKSIPQTNPETFCLSLPRYFLHVP
jgi:hypothetical protein